MVLLKYIVFLALVSCSLSAEVVIGQRFKRDADNDFQKIFEILTAQDEKINRLLTMVVTNQNLPKCATALKNENLIAGNNCLKSMVTKIKTIDQSSATEIDVLSQLVTESYDGKKTRLSLIATFIMQNVEKGSEAANKVYKALLDAMDSFGHLYLRHFSEDDGMGSGLIDYTYRTLIQIRKAEGETSPIFTEMLPDVVNSILNGKEVYIRNNATKGFMYAPPTVGDNVAKILLNNDLNKDDPRYIWKLKPVEKRWNRYNQESFYIENTFENKILTVASSNGSLKLAETTSEQYDSTWSMFYVRFIKGGSGEEVVIQCSYWGIKVLALDANDSWKMPKLQDGNTLERKSTGIWLLQPKV